MHKSVQRSGLDYHELAEVQVHDDFAACLRVLAARGADGSHAALVRADDEEARPPTTRCASPPATSSCSGPRRGACRNPCWPPARLERRLRIPMREGARSLNLSNSVAVVVYEAWRQLGWR